MISVDRSAVSLPEILDPAGSKGAAEGLANIKAILEHIANPPPPPAPGKKPPKPKLKFETYKEDEVKLALHRLFHGKCAYCESRYAAAAPMDVEHFRPKKAVEKWKKIPARPRGYYWLGAEWSNLLPSCIDCNRRREHLNFDEPEVEAPNLTGLTLGKRAFFPVADEEKRWGAHDAENKEQPLLLNPCVPGDRPEKVLLFDKNGLVRRRPRLKKAVAERVEASIEIFGLNRPGLVQERKAWADLLAHRMVTIDKVVVIMDKLVDGTPQMALADNLLQFLLDDLKSFQHPRRPYSLMARQLTEEFLADFE